MRPGSSGGATRSDQVWERRNGGSLPDGEPGTEVIPERHAELLVRVCHNPVIIYRNPCDMLIADALIMIFGFDTFSAA